MLKHLQNFLLLKLAQTFSEKKHNYNLLITFESLPGYLLARSNLSPFLYVRIIIDKAPVFGGLQIIISVIWIRMDSKFFSSGWCLFCCLLKSALICRVSRWGFFFSSMALNRQMSTPHNLCVLIFSYNSISIFKSIHLFHNNRLKFITKFALGCIHS